MFHEHMIPLPNKPKVVQKKGESAVFEIAPLYPGYGVTIGNTYRRVLLSSLEGAAITQVKIKGANHEFSTIPGVLEDVLIILLNLKKIRFKSWSAEPQIIDLKVKKMGVVKAKDFNLNPQLKIANPELELATITDKKTELEIEVKIEKGFGYVESEEREEKRAEVGNISLDANFTPVKKVSFRIENMIVGKRTDFERLEISIETDGTILPEEAFYRATDILFGHFSLFSEFGKEKEEKAKEVAIQEKKSAKKPAKGGSASGGEKKARKPKKEKKIKKK